MLAASVFNVASTSASDLLHDYPRVAKNQRSSFHHARLAALLLTAERLCIPILQRLRAISSALMLLVCSCLNRQL